VFPNKSKSSIRNFFQNYKDKLGLQAIFEDRMGDEDDDGFEEEVISKRKVRGPPTEPVALGAVVKTEEAAAAPAVEPPAVEPPAVEPPAVEPPAVEPAVEPAVDEVEATPPAAQPAPEPAPAAMEVDEGAPEAQGEGDASAMQLADEGA
jgi:hypothetical protein